MKSQIWVFGSDKGNNYSDNSRALFEYASSINSNIKPIWLTRNRAVRDRIRSQGYNSHLFYSVEGIYCALKAETLVLTHSFLDLSLVCYLLPRQKFIVQLWHGTPLKVLENMQWKFGKRLLMNAFLRYIGRDCDIVLTATALNTEAYIKNFRVKKDQIVLAGQPRNDFLARKAKDTSGRKKIWYVPTFREYDRGYNFFKGLDTQAFDTSLEKYQAHMYIKLHNSDKKMADPLEARFAKCKNISIAHPENFYGELGKADILITDYSSVYFDFLILNRPIIFTPFDIKKYDTSRGFYYEYDEVTPGAKAQDWAEVQEYVEQILKGNDSWRAQREKISSQFNLFSDADNSKRAFEVITKELAS